jgi:hypothetical protein
MGAVTFKPHDEEEVMGKSKYQIDQNATMPFVEDGEEMSPEEIVLSKYKKKKLEVY